MATSRAMPQRHALGSAPLMVPYKTKLQHRVSLAGFCCAALVASVLGAAYAWSRRMHGQQPFPIAAHALWMLLPALNTAVAVLLVIAHLTGLPMYQRHWVALDSAFIYGTSLALACLYFTRPPVGALLPDPFYMALLHANCGNLVGHPLLSSLLGNTLLVPVYVVLDWRVKGKVLLQWLPRGLAMLLMLHVSVFSAKMVIGFDEWEEQGAWLCLDERQRRQQLRQGQHAQQLLQHPQQHVPRPPAPQPAAAQRRAASVALGRGRAPHASLLARPGEWAADRAVQALSFYVYLQQQAPHLQRWIFSDRSRFVTLFCAGVIAYQTVILCVKEALYGSRSMEVIVKPSFLFIGIVASWMLGYLGRPVR